MKRERVKNQLLRFMTSLTCGFLIFLCPSNCIADRAGMMAPATVSTVKITIVLYAAEDSTAVVQYAASLVDASTSTTLDSLGSGTVNVIAFNVATTGVSNEGSTIPSKYSLDQNFPDPFNPSTIIRFSILGAENVQLSVYDILGRRVANLVDQWLSSGTYQLNWSPNVASGTYFYRLQSGKFSETKKMIVLDGSGHTAGASQLTVQRQATWQGARQGCAERAS